MRWKLGALLGWDDPAEGVGSRVMSLRDRLPEDLRDAPEAGTTTRCRSRPSTSSTTNRLGNWRTGPCTQ
ncbi:hypothetical protein ACFQZC_38120 [Streptacidiphilus monticola]